MTNSSPTQAASTSKRRFSLKETFGVLPKFRRAFRLLGEKRAQVIRGLLCMPLSGITVLWIATLLGQIVDALRAADDNGYTRGDLARDCALLAGLAVLDAFLRFGGRHQLINASRHMEARLKSDLTAHIQKLPIRWFDEARTGDLLSRLTQDVELIRFVTGPTLLYGTTSLILVPGGIWVMLSFSPLVAAAAGVAFAVMLVGIARLMPAMQTHSKAAQEAIAEISQRAAESFSGIRVLFAYAGAGRESATMRVLSEGYVRHNIDLARLRARFNVLVHGCRELVVIAVVVLGALEVTRGAMTVGELLSFLALLGAMIWPLIAIGWIVGTWHRAIAATDRIEEIFATEPEPRAPRRSASRSSEPPSIRITNLTFAYRENGEPALRDVSLTIQSGQKIGITGPVGSGKSTLLALLLRFYDPPRGTVFVDEVDVLDIDPAELRSRIASAPQDPFLFSDTLSGNILFGAEGDPTPEHESSTVRVAAKTAKLDADFEAFPDGWDTVVGERGVTLSGGQKQRTSLARALASDRSTLLLDDTLSAVDHATEARILDGLRSARGDRTTLTVAHRLSILRDADLILVFDRGRLLDHGTHRELLDRPGFYAETWRRQRDESRLEQGEFRRYPDGGSD